MNGFAPILGMVLKPLCETIAERFFVGSQSLTVFVFLRCVFIASEVDPIFAGIVAASGFENAYCVFVASMPLVVGA